MFLYSGKCQLWAICFMIFGVASYPKPLNLTYTFRHLVWLPRTNHSVMTHLSQSDWQLAEQYRTSHWSQQPAVVSRALSQYPKRRLFVRSRKVSKPRDWYFKLSYHCCRSACQISERSDNSKYKSRGFETLRDLTEWRLSGYWDGAQMASPICWLYRTRTYR